VRFPEFPGPGGGPARLAIKAKSVDVPVRWREIGQVVALHVNSKAERLLPRSWSGSATSWVRDGSPSSVADDPPSTGRVGNGLPRQ
jgi:hypothetical protein